MVHQAILRIPDRYQVVTQVFQKLLSEERVSVAMLFDLPPIDAVVAQLKDLKIPQRVLAARAGVTQATVSKMYKGRDARYSVVRGICRAAEAELERVEPSLRAGEVCAHPALGVQRVALMREAVDFMRRKKFDQIVVFEGKKLVGSLAWTALIRAVNSGIPLEELKQRQVSAFMQPPFPIVNEDESLAVVEMLLAYHPAVLVRIRGKLGGIITWDDVLGHGSQRSGPRTRGKA